MARHIKIFGFEQTTLLENDRSFDDNVHFGAGIPRENATNADRLAERALLQGAQSGLLDDRVSVDAEEEEF